jgi:hypothetical protein
MARRKTKATKPKTSSRIINAEKYTPRRLNAHYQGPLGPLFTPKSQN